MAFKVQSSMSSQFRKGTLEGISFLPRLFNNRTACSTSAHGSSQKQELKHVSQEPQNYGASGLLSIGRNMLEKD